MRTPAARARRRSLVTVIAMALACTGIGAPITAPAVAAATALTAIYAEGPGWPAEGHSTYATDGTTTWTVTRSTDGNSLDIEIVDPGTPSNDWSLRLAAPSGATIGVGAYPDAGYPQGTGTPGLDLGHDGQRCSPAFGAFTIAALAVSGAGDVSSLALSIEEHCQAADAPVAYLDVRFASTVPLRATGLSPSPVDFGSQVTGRTSTTHDITLAASGDASSTVASVALAGPEAGDFKIATDGCDGTTVAPGTTCQISVTFKPSAVGQRQATLVVTDDTYPATHSVDLTGTGRAFSIAPLSLDFGQHKVWTTSSATITLVNGNQAAAVDTYFTSYGPMVNDFSIRKASGCSALSTVPALGSCDLTIDFVPTIFGTSSATLGWSVGGDTGTSVQLSGTGIPTSGVGWAPPRTVRGATWTSGKSLARTTHGTASYLHTVVTLDLIQNHWVTDHGPYLGVYYKRSANGGGRYGPSVRLNPINKHGDRGAVASQGANVYGIWVSQTKWIKYSRTAPRVLYIRSNKHSGVGAFGAAHRLTPLAGRVDYPAVATYGNFVYVAYTDASSGKVRVAISRNGGRTWATVTLGSTTQTFSDGKAGMPSVSATGALVVVAWTADASGKVIAKTSTSAGRTWTGATLDTASSSDVATAAGSGRLAVAWVGPDGLRLRTWQASVWGPVAVAAAPGVPTDYSWATTPAIALLGTGQVGATWGACHLDCSTGEPKVDLLWTESTDGGLTFPFRQVIAIGMFSGPNYPQNWYPSLVWGSATSRYVMYSAESIGEGGHQVRLLNGLGSPN